MELNSFILNIDSLLQIDLLETVLHKDFLFYLAVGFLAALIDGALGMAYGVSCNTMLLGLGVSPAVASASVHIAKIFTGGVSGLAHWRLGNIERKLLWQLTIFGSIGGAIGAYFISKLNYPWIKPGVAIYLLSMGVLILIRAFKKVLIFKDPKRIEMLAAFGGFMDSIGGGGWGPIVTGSLLGGGKKPSITIGTVNSAEFFVAFVSSLVFGLLLKLTNLEVIFALILGGMLAAPLGAIAVKWIQPRYAMILVGVTIIVLSFRLLYISLY